MVSKTTPAFKGTGGFINETTKRHPEALPPDIFDAIKVLYTPQKQFSLRGAFKIK